MAITLPSRSRAPGERCWVCRTPAVCLWHVSVALSAGRAAVQPAAPAQAAPHGQRHADVETIPLSKESICGVPPSKTTVWKAGLWGLWPREICLRREASSRVVAVRSAPNQPARHPSHAQAVGSPLMVGAAFGCAAAAGVCLVPPPGWRASSDELAALFCLGGPADLPPRARNPQVWGCTQSAIY